MAERDVDPKTTHDNLRSELVCRQRRHDHMERMALVVGVVFIGGVGMSLSQEVLVHWAWSHPHQSTLALVLFAMLAVSVMRALLGGRWDAADVIDAIRGSLHGAPLSDAALVEPEEKAAPSTHPDLGILGIAMLMFVGLLKLLMPGVLGFTGMTLLVAKLVFGGLAAGLFLFWALRSLRSEPPDDPASLPDEILRRLRLIRRRSPRSSWATWLEDSRGRIELYLYISVWAASAIAIVVVWR